VGGQLEKKTTEEAAAIKRSKGLRGIKPESPRGVTMQLVKKKAVIRSTKGRIKAPVSSITRFTTRCKKTEGKGKKGFSHNSQNLELRPAGFEIGEILSGRQTGTSETLRGGESGCEMGRAPDAEIKKGRKFRGKTPS